MILKFCGRFADDVFGGAISGLNFYNTSSSTTQTTHYHHNHNHHYQVHSRRRSKHSTTNVTILFVVCFLFCFFVTGCQGDCPKCGGKYPDARLRTGGVAGGGVGGGGGRDSGGAPPFKLDPAELKAFKRSFLSKLGLKRPPSRAQVARTNVSSDVLHNMKRVYELSMLDNNKSHELFPEVDTKRFFSFAGTGE